MRPVCHYLEPGLAVAAQLLPEQIAELPSMGFQAVIANRPDGEAADQPTMDQIEAAASAVGLPFRRIPVVGGAITDADIEAFRRSLDDLPSPILAYCRSGNRCCILWSLARAGAIPVDELIARGGQAGFDLEPQRPRLTQRVERAR